MKLRATHSWCWFCALALCLLSSGALFAQEEPAEQAPEIVPLLFEGTLNDGNDSEGNNAVFNIAINAGDQIIATALCEMAADGLRHIDPALTVYAPQAEDSLERLQWYNDDSDTVSDCIDYRSSQVSFEAPVSGDYEFLIENLASRSGPFTLEILGSTAIQIGADLAPPVVDEEVLVESGADEPPELAALDAPQEDAEDGVEATEVGVQGLLFSGLLAAKDDESRAQRSYEIMLNAGDEIVAELTCEEAFGGRWVDPALFISYTDAEGAVISWENDDHDSAAACLSYRSARVEFTAPEDGTYIFQAKNLAYYKGTYTLSVNGVAAPQLTIMEPGQAPIWDGDSEAPGRMTTFEGQLEVKGEGTHVVQLQEGERIAALAACETDDNSLRSMDPLLRVLDPTGELVLQVDDSLDYQDCAAWYSAYGEFTPAITGEYTFIVRNVARETNGPYSLVLVQPTLSALASAVDPGAGGESSTVARVDDTRLGTLGGIGSVFLVNTDKGPRVDVYAIDSSSAGHHVLSVYGNQLDSAPNNEILLASGEGGAYSAYHRPDGSLRFSAGPNIEGKNYHMILSGIPGEVISIYDELITITASAVPIEDTAPIVTIIAVHVVQEGETLYSIGVQYGVGYEAIAAFNGIDDSYIIHVGTELQIPSH